MSIPLLATGCPLLIKWHFLFGIPTSPSFFHSSPVFVNLPCSHLNTLGFWHLGTAKKSAQPPKLGWDPNRGTDETSSYTTKKPHRLGGGNLSWEEMAWLMRGFRSFFRGRPKGKKPKDPWVFLKKTRLGCFFGGEMHLWFFFWGGWDESLWNISTQESRTRCFFPSCGIVESSDDSSLQRKTGKWCSLQNIPLCCFWSKDYDSAVSQTSKLMKQTNKSCWFVGSTGFLSIGLSAFSTSQKFNKECQYFWNTK